jgi:putative peptidoglycan lipid II flippase
LIGVGFGFVRDILIAGRFGTGSQTDAYYLAFTIPTVIWLTSAVALPAAFIPIYFEVEHRSGHADATHFLVGSMWVLGLLLSIAAGFYAIFAPTILTLLAGDTQSGETIQQAVSLARIMSPIVPISVLCSIGASTLYARGRYVVPALASPVLNISIIACVLLDPRFNVAALAIGTLLGFVAQLVVQMFMFRDIGPEFRKGFAPQQHPMVKPFIKLLLLSLIGFNLFNHGVSVLERGFAVQVGPGTVTAMAFAVRLSYVPLQLATAVGVTSLPFLVRHVTLDQQSEFQAHLNRSTGLVMLVVAPLGLVLLLLADTVVALLFQRGAFDAYATRMTASALQGYALGLPATAMILVLAPAFYARRDMGTPIILTIVGLVVYVVANIGFGIQHGAFGVALGTSLASWCVLAGMLVAFRLKVGQLESIPLILRIARSSILAVLCFGGSYVLWRTLAAFASQDSDAAVSTGRPVALLVSSTGFLAYAVVVWAARFDEARYLSRAVADYLSRAQRLARLCLISVVRR